MIFALTIENMVFDLIALRKASVSCLAARVLLFRQHNPCPLKLIYHDTKEWRSQ